MDKSVVSIRPIREADADQFLRLRTHLDGETKFMMLEPGERSETVEQSCEHIREVLASSNSTIFVAELDGELVGYLSVNGGRYLRNRATGYIVAGVLQRAAGQGVGRRLFTSMIDWAGKAGLHRLELTVMTHNKRALGLYQKMGFEIEGVEKEGLQVDGQWVDEFLMAKLLP